ncbi:hypothetical protein GCM10017559_77450 [Streptosporangium longisporum]|uniref:Uncharacterized protein n=1 Tax=Streptosporangium longisporum TaxID=46187 RepID=A0ABP6LAP2_9ACTN
MEAPIMGSSSRPELVAVAPGRFCWKSGRKLIAPNMRPSRNPNAEIKAEVRRGRRAAAGWARGAALHRDEQGQRDHGERRQAEDLRRAQA